jgi:hypothetical protein
MICFSIPCADKMHLPNGMDEMVEMLQNMVTKTAETLKCLDNSHKADLKLNQTRIL